MTRKRRLRPEERELWDQVARSADPLHPQKKRKQAEGATPPPAKAKPKENGETREPLSPFDVGQSARRKTETLIPPETSSERLRGQPVRMDSKAFTRLKRGKLSPEARIDLHGMTLDRAHGALNRFILQSQGRGLRLVLVITGKGAREDPYDPLPRPRGVLKRQVPMWLQQPPLAQAVLQTAPAHIRHGGDGALYVYLRRAR